MSVADVCRQDHVLSEIARLAADCRAIEQVTLFGSRARGDAGPRSDYDLLVAAPDASTSEWIRFVTAIADLPTLLERTVLRDEEIGDELRQRVAEEGVVVYRRAMQPQGQTV